jgi:hypothetical protein
VSPSRSGFAPALLALLAAALISGYAFIGPGDIARAGIDSSVPARTISPQDEEASRIGPPPAAAARIAGKFGAVRPAVQSAAPFSQEPAAPARPADWLRPLGGFEDTSGRAWLFIKDDRSGRAIKLRIDGTQSEDGRIVAAAKDAYEIEVEGMRYSVRRR